MRVAVLGHRGMLGSVVARYLNEQRHEVLVFGERYPDGLIAALNEAQPSCVVNCISGGWPENAGLPSELDTWPLIQPSTDAIGEDSEYARSKAAGERGLSIRAGIVDITRQHRVAYPEWTCNPLTPLEWARLAERQLLRADGVQEHGGYPIDRYSLAVMVADIFGTEPPILGHAEPRSRVMAVTHKRYIRDALLEYREWLRS